MAKAYSYLRFSTPDQQQGDSFRRHTKLAKVYATQHGLELDDQLTFQDLGISAFRSQNAKTRALRSFLEAVESGAIEPGSYLLVESLDRISRDSMIEAQTPMTLP
jgi:DNA invertase Pin-like site-specific DNA recombinase